MLPFTQRNETARPPPNAGGSDTFVQHSNNKSGSRVNLSHQPSPYRTPGRVGGVGRVQFPALAPRPLPPPLHVRVIAQSMPISNNEPAFKPLGPNALFLHRCTLYKLTMADRSQICGKHDYFYYEGPTIDDWVDDCENKATSTTTLSANAASNGEFPEY